MAAQPPPGRFPALATHNLDGAAVTVPDDLPGPADLVVLAFRRRQQADVDGWRAAVATDWREGLGFWEVPVIGRGWGPLRGWIDGGMAGAIGNPEIRAHTLTVYTDVGVVQRALGIAGSGAVVAILVVDGEVRWQTTGAVDPARLAGLRSALDRVAPGG
jgi:hypothetical protein